MKTRILLIVSTIMLWSGVVLAADDEPWLPKNAPETYMGQGARFPTETRYLNKEMIEWRGASYRGFNTDEEPADAKLWHGVDIYHGSK
ncbi:hypothetical protein [Marinobacterium arenosum]|uniref:hypothetical protein n=1 Tax=Marinobacterium arenosum TaxID=2862496 RepID=UPI001C98B7D9|nr:hypothetical protein [Marinobacterium arenosum]MBY4677893.1 hypothetical protein [Marinobacterium arenosum]